VSEISGTRFSAGEATPTGKDSSNTTPPTSLAEQHRHPWFERLDVDALNEGFEQVKKSGLLTHFGSFISAKEQIDRIIGICVFFHVGI
jgi:hypothetical protein